MRLCFTSGLWTRWFGGIQKKKIPSALPLRRKGWIGQILPCWLLASCQSSFLSGEAWSQCLSAPNQAPWKLPSLGALFVSGSTRIDFFPWHHLHCFLEEFVIGNSSPKQFLQALDFIQRLRILSGWDSFLTCAAPRENRIFFQIGQHDNWQLLLSCPALPGFSDDNDWRRIASSGITSSELSRCGGTSKMWRNFRHKILSINPVSLRIRTRRTTSRRTSFLKFPLFSWSS